MLKACRRTIFAVQHIKVNNTMSKYILQIIILLTLITPNSLRAQKAKYISKWQTQPFIVNYQSPSWSDKMNYNYKSKFMYSISNDSNNLYVRIKVFDKALQMKMLRSGFTLWIDTVGKKKKTLAIKYPLHNQARTVHNGNYPNKRNPDLTSNRKRAKTKATNVPNEMHLSGFGNYGKLPSKDNSLGIVVQVDKDPIGNLYYFAIVPLASIYKRDTMFYIPKNLFSICFETGSIEQNRNSEPRGNHNGSGGPPDEQGIRDGRGMQGGGEQGARPNSYNMEGQRDAIQESMATPSELWIKKISFSRGYKIHSAIR